MAVLETLRNEILPKVNKPGQYLGLEWGSYRKNWDTAKSRIALIYPDLYELGMSNFGIKILYNIVNQHPDYLCDRAYGVMPDMEELLEQRNLPLWAWESYKPLGDFDMLGFSLAYELCYTNIFTILNLPKIPFLSSERSHQDPLIFAGGPAVFNPEPMAEYFDFFLVGDGEETIIEIQDQAILAKKKFLEQHLEVQSELAKKYSKLSVDELYRELKNFDLEPELSQKLREQILLAIAQIQGVYVPRFYKPDPKDNYLAKPCRDDVPFPVFKRVTQNLGDFNQPVSGPVPYISTVQDKQVLEIRRGCDRGCRFCQVGYTYLPVRERSPEDLLRLSTESVKKSGYEDMTLLSLSASDYTCLTEAARAINDEHAEDGVALSMPSQRADRFDVELADEVSQARKSGMTFAPEAGTERMRKIINKGLGQEDIFKSIKGTYLKGWSHIKLYFMIGLPFEEDEDLDGILDILSWSVNMSRQLQKANPEMKLKPIRITCTISTFVPKSFTAFQWFSQTGVEEFHRKQDYLKNALRERKLHRNVKLNCTEPELALIESVLSRGDRRWAKVIKSIWDSGSRLDSWSENFNIERWQKAAAKHGLDLQEEASKHREPGSKQCWDVLSIGFTNEFLLKEWQQAVEANETAPCTENKCHACGVCFNLNVKNLVTIDRSEANPFVAELDKDRRKEVCAGSSHFSKRDPSVSLQDDGEVLNQDDGEFLNRNDGNSLNQDHGNSSRTPRVIVKNTISKQKLRLTITKLGDLRFLSHLDFQRLIERALRRTSLPIVHTTGFNQRIKITWGTALPLFVESQGEYLEIDLAENFDNLENLKEILNHELPKQARITQVVRLAPDDKTSIGNVLEAVYLARLSNCQSFNQNTIDSFLSQDHIKVKRFSKGKEKVVDIKPNILRMKVDQSDSIELTLVATQRADQVLQAFIPDAIWTITKIEQHLA